MASFIRLSKQEQARFLKRAGSPLFDGEQAEAGAGGAVFQESNYGALPELFALDLRWCGATYEQLGRWFGRSRSGAFAWVNELQDKHFGAYRQPDADYVERVKAVLEEDPPALTDLIRELARRNGVLDPDRAIDQLGSRRKSMESAFEGKRKSRAKGR